MNTLNQRHLILALALVLALVPFSVFADGDTDSIQGTADATLIRPLTITHQSGQLSFGTLIVNNISAPVTVTFDPLSGLAPSIVSSNPAEVMPMEGHSDVTFEVHGEPDRVVQVGIDTQILISTGGGGTPSTEMTISNINVDIVPYANAGAEINNDATNQFTLPTDGMVYLQVGGVLTVDTDDTFGPYTGAYNVTVSYL